MSTDAKAIYAKSHTLICDAFHDAGCQIPEPDYDAGVNPLNAALANLEQSITRAVIEEVASRDKRIAELEAQVETVRAEEREALIARMMLPSEDAVMPLSLIKVINAGAEVTNAYVGKRPEDFHFGTFQWASEVWQAMLKAFVTAEREACAKIANDHAEYLELRGSRSCGEAFQVAEEIRARSSSGNMADIGVGGKE